MQQATIPLEKREAFIKRIKELSGYLTPTDDHEVGEMFKLSPGTVRQIRKGERFTLGPASELISRATKRERQLNESLGL